MTTTIPATATEDVRASLALRMAAVSVRPDAAAFLALLLGDRDVRVIDALEAWVYQHRIRHVGEIEHARALVGLGGVS